MDRKKELYQIITAAWNVLREYSSKAQLSSDEWEMCVKRSDEETKKHSGAEFVFARKVFCAVLDYLEEIGKEKDERS